MNKLIISSISLLIFTFIILPLCATFAIKVIPGGIQPSLGNTIKIYGQYVYSESFISPADNLTGIGVSIKNPNFANKKKTIVNLYDDKDKLIKEVTLNGRNIADGKFVKILFEPITNSKDKKFTWSISSSESTFEDALEIFLTDKRPTWSLDFRVNNKPLQSGMSYITLHRPETNITVLQMVIADWMNKIKGDSIFFLNYFLLLLILVSVLYLPDLYRRIRKNKS